MVDTVLQMYAYRRRGDTFQLGYFISGQAVVEILLHNLAATGRKIGYEPLYKQRRVGDLRKFKPVEIIRTERFDMNLDLLGGQVAEHAVLKTIVAQVIYALVPDRTKQIIRNRGDKLRTTVPDGYEYIADHLRRYVPICHERRRIGAKRRVIGVVKHVKRAFVALGNAFQQGVVDCHLY